MRRDLSAAALACLLLASGCAEARQAPVAEGEWVRVGRVIDGDTIEVAGGERVRLIGINAPEYQPWRGHVEDFGHQASVCAEDLLAGQRVRLELDVERRDKYGRLLAYVYLEDGRMANELLVAQGCARARDYRPNSKHRRSLAEAQQRAKQALAGLWGPDR